MDLKLNNWAIEILSPEELTRLKPTTYNGSPPEIRRFYCHGEGLKHYKTLLKISEKYFDGVRKNKDVIDIPYMLDPLTPVEIIESMAFSSHMKTVMDPVELIKTKKINKAIEQIKEKMDILDGLLHIEGLEVDGSIALPSIDLFEENLSGRHHWGEIIKGSDFEETYYEKLHDTAINALEHFEFTEFVQASLDNLSIFVNKHSEYKISKVKIPSKRLYNIRWVVFTILDCLSGNNRYKLLALDSIKDVNFHSLIGYISGLLTTGEPLPSTTCRTEVLEAIEIWKETGKG